MRTHRVVVSSPGNAAEQRGPGRRTIDRVRAWFAPHAIVKPVLREDPGLTPLVQDLPGCARRAGTRGAPSATLVGAAASLLLLTYGARSEDAQAKPVAAQSALVGRLLVCGVPTAGTIEVRRRERDAPVAKGAPVAKAQTDAAGAFRILGIEEGRYEVRALVPGMVAGFSWAHIPDAIEVEVPIQVPGGPEHVRGRARWPDGSPFRGVLGLGWWQGWAHLRLAGTNCDTFVETDAEGRFRFEGVKRGLVSLDALALPVYSGPILTNISLPIGDIDIVVAADATRVHGRVVDAATGVPIASGFVQVRSWSRDWTAPVKDGAFELVVARNADALIVGSEGYARARIERADVLDGIVVRLERGFSVEGITKDVGGKPIAGVRVFASHQAADWDTVTLTATTDDHGRYRIDGLPRGDPMVYALGAGFATRGIHPWSKEGNDALRVALDPKGPVTKDFVLEKAGVVRLRVLDAGGRPARGTAWLRPRMSYFDLWDAAGDLGISRGSDDGTIEFKTVVPGVDHDVMVAVPGHPGHSVRGVVVQSGGVLPLDVVLPAVRWLDVRVIEDPSGKPIAGASVASYRRSAEGSWNGDEQAVRWLTDADGKARVGPLATGEVGVSVDTDDYAAVDGPANVQRLDPDGVTTIRLKAGGVIAGRIESPTPLGGHPIEVRFRRRSTPGHGYESDETWLNAIEGIAFRTRGLEGEAYVVKASVRVGSDLFEAEGSASTGTKDLVLRLRRSEPHEARFRVLDPDGRPVPSAEAQVFPLLDGRRERGLAVAIRSGDGRQEVPSEVAEVTVEVRNAKDADGRALPLAAGMFGPFPVKSKPIELRLSRERPASGFVRDTSDDGVAGVVVHAIPLRSMGTGPEMWLGEFGHSEATTGPDGAFALHGLGERAYELRCAVPEAYAAPEPIQLTSGAKAPVEFVLEPGTSVTVRVVDAEDRPLDGAQVMLWWWTADGARQFGHLNRYMAWIASEGGIVRFSGLRRGRRYTLRVEPPDTHTHLGKIERDPWSLDDRDFRLVGRRHLGGVVLDAKGDPMAEVEVGWRRTTGGPWIVVHSDAKGKFEFDDIGEGAVFLGPRGMPRVGAGGAISFPLQGARLALDTSVTIAFESPTPLESGVAMRFGGPGVGTGTPTDFPEELTSDRPTILANLDASATYSAYFGPTPDGRCFYAEGLRPNGEVIEVKLDRSPVIRARLVGLSDEARRKGVEVGVRRGRISIGLLLLADDRVDGIPLPTGTRWTLYARGPGLSGERTKEFDAAADGILDLDMR